MIGVSSIIDSLLEEQRSVIKFLIAEGEKPCHIFQRLKAARFQIHANYHENFENVFKSIIQ
jgi:hypothetical protein